MRVAVILAAGKGVRMRSELPKVFHKIDDRPMLSLVLDAVREGGFDRTYIIVGYKAEMIMDFYKDEDVMFVEQKERLGTGHAVMQVEAYLAKEQGTVVVLNGDMPLITPKTIKDLISFHESSSAKATVLTAKVGDPFGYGRIKRGHGGEVERIVEERDASESEKKIDEINTGVYCFDIHALFKALKHVKPENDQKEYYLTDTIALIRKEHAQVFSFVVSDPLEAMGVNTREELHLAEQTLRAKASA